MGPGVRTMTYLFWRSPFNSLQGFRVTQPNGDLRDGVKGACHDATTTGRYALLPFAYRNPTWPSPRFHLCRPPALTWVRPMTH